MITGLFIGVGCYFTASYTRAHFATKKANIKPFSVKTTAIKIRTPKQTSEEDEPKLKQVFCGYHPLPKLEPVKFPKMELNFIEPKVEEEIPCKFVPSTKVDEYLFYSNLISDKQSIQEIKTTEIVNLPLLIRTKEIDQLFYVVDKNKSQVFIGDSIESVQTAHRNSYLYFGTEITELTVLFFTYCFLGAFTFVWLVLIMDF